MHSLRIFVVDDHSLFRQGVIHTVMEEPDMTVVGEAGTAASAIEKVRDTLPEIVLLDLRLPDRSGLEVITTLRAECPYSRVIALTVVEDEEALLEALKRGASGYLLKGISGSDLVRVIRSVASGETYVSPTMAGCLFQEMAHPSGATGPWGTDTLTEREAEILKLVAQGLTNKEVADRLYLSEKTVKHYMTNILQKLQVRNRVEAALIAIRKGTAL